MMAGSYREAEPAVSPNGNYVAYTRFLDGGGSDICIAATDLSKRAPCNSPLTGSNGNSQAAWSPDSQWIAYTNHYGGNIDIYVIMISGAGRNNLTDDPAYDMYPAWQPIPPAL